MKLRREQERGRDLLAPPRLVSEWLFEWLSEVKSRDGTRHSTLDRYRGVVERHLVPALGQKRLDKLTPREVQSFLGQLSDRMAPASVVKIHGVLRSALSDAQRLDLVPRNVAKAAKPPSLQATKRRALNVAEAQRLLAAASGDRLEALFVIALTMGLRRGELLGLQWSDLDHADHVLSIERAVQRAAGQLRFVEPKTPRSCRVLPVPKVAMAAFNAHRARQFRERLAAGDSWHGGDLIFASSIGTPMEPRNVNRRFNELRARAGLDWLRLHDLRHACATYLLANGVEPRTVMEILGHSTIRLTMDLYGHVLPDRLRAAASAMDRAMEAR
jgi:integrase